MDLYIKCGLIKMDSTMYLQHVKPHCKPMFVIHYCALCWLSCFSWKEAFWKNKFLVFPRSCLSSHDWNHLATSVKTTHKCWGRSAILNTSFCVSSHFYSDGLFRCEQGLHQNVPAAGEVNFSIWYSFIWIMWAVGSKDKTNYQLWFKCVSCFWGFFLSLH